ncbi:MAG TPA: DUF3108 domain-containing protein [Caldithrix abyssi]|uniref:DUF3108 domain-containing protein n=1 Tax=Caldithrix abyssi TaxID=187145 RepID=A0A7V5RNL1_CALAY|nr:DUF3108 domain-containing protein [Caldithrix abyssi]
MKKLILLLFLLIGLSPAQDRRSFRFVDGEELTFRVDYSFFNLGEIKMAVNREVSGKDSLYHIHLTIESNPLLFWVDNQSVYDSYIDKNLRVHRFISDEKVDGETYKAEYTFNYKDSLMYRKLIAVDTPGREIVDVMPLRKDMIDGISLIFFARANVDTKKRDTVYTFIENKSGDVIFNFHKKYTHTETDVFPRGIGTIFFDGHLNISGIAGVSGPFSAYFSRDPSHVPLLSFLKVFVGKVTITLVGWQGWRPAP